MEAKSAIYSGSSMLGTLFPGDRIYLVPATFSSLECGDIVAVKSDHSEYIHRVIAIDENQAVTMGDNNDAPDPVKLDFNSEFMRLGHVETPSGMLRCVAQGKAGMKQFARIRNKRKFFHLLRRMWHTAEKIFIFRLTLTKFCTFADGSRVYYFGRFPILHSDSAGSVLYRKLWQKLFFVIGCEE